MIPEGFDYPALVRGQLAKIEQMLLTKNEQYGNSALDPMRIFSRADAKQGIRVRIDDKLSRIARRPPNVEESEDVIADLMGYLVHYQIADELERKAREGAGGDAGFVDTYGGERIAFVPGLGNVKLP